MARLKKTETVSAGVPEIREQLPEHVRVPEWNGIKQGDPVRVERPTKGAVYEFLAYVTPPTGKPYIDVIEKGKGRTVAGKREEGKRLQRSVTPERVSKW